MQLNNVSQKLHVGLVIVENVTARYFRIQRNQQLASQ